MVDNPEISIMIRFLGCIGLLALGAVAGCNRPGNPAPASDVAIVGEPWLEDVTERVGLDFTHDCGPVPGNYFMPQVVGSGCAVFDFDGDGLQDIYLINNGGPNGAKNRLFRQMPDHTFRDVSAGSGLDVAGFGMGVAIGDVNNDGLPDVLLTEFGKTRLFLNEGGGRFREITREAGIVNPSWGTSAAFFDFDRDGWLDLIVVNYLDYDPSFPCRDGAGKPEYCGPQVFQGATARLYRNLGGSNVRFEDVSLKAGLDLQKGKGLGVLCADFDGDGWPDIFVANDQLANHLWINQHNGTFREQATTRGVALTGAAARAANMGIAWCDVDGDGLPDLFVSHLVVEDHTLWKQGPRGIFRDQTAAAGLITGFRATGFGAAFVDIDCDGWPDLAIVNGGVSRNQAADTNAAHWLQYAQQNQLFANDGHGKFRDISKINPALCGMLNVGRGLAVVDYNNDGAPDLLITEAGGRARLLRNIANPRGHWLLIRATIPSLKRDAYGAEVSVHAGDKTIHRLLNPGYSYCSSNDPRGHFGLGSADRYDSIVVKWPDGRVESFPGGAADRQIELRQGDGTAKQ
jgi:enediyne biosynthesis protein E4